NIPIMDSMIQKGVLSLLKTELIKIILIFIMIMPYLLSHLNKVEFLLYFCRIALFNIFYSLYQHSLLHLKWINFLFFLIYLFLRFKHYHYRFNDNKRCFKLIKNGIDKNNSYIHYDYALPFVSFK